MRSSRDKGPYKRCSEDGQRAEEKARQWRDATPSPGRPEPQKLDKARKDPPPPRSLQTASVLHARAVLCLDRRWQGMWKRPLANRPVAVGFHRFPNPASWGWAPAQKAQTRPHGLRRAGEQQAACAARTEV